MSWLQKIERRFEPFAISNAILYIVIVQTFVYLSWRAELLDVNRLILVPNLVRDGEWWRLVTFVADPPSAGWVLIAFALYFLYLTGSALESEWGAVRFNAFLLVGYALTVAAAFVTPNTPATNVFIGGSIFLAFAHRHPDFTIYLFFLLPVQIKWLALLTWILTAWKFAEGDFGTRLAIAASLTNFFLFMGRDVWLSLRAGQRRMASEARRISTDARPAARHRCHVCGKTDLTNPELDFRYCSKCAGDQCYCPDHIRNHQHVLTDGNAKS